MKSKDIKFFVPDSANRLYNSKPEALKAKKTAFKMKICPNSGIRTNATNELISFDDGYLSSQNSSIISETNTENMIELLEKFVPKEKSIREIGCGNGIFLEQLQRKGFTNLHGYDASCTENNDLVSNRYLDNSDFPLNADVIILRHVLDEVPSPISFLNKILEINSKPFLLFMEILSFDQIISSERAWDLSNERIYYFTESSIRRTFGSNIKELTYTAENQNMLMSIDFNAQLTKELNLTHNDHESITHLIHSLDKQIKQLKKLLRNNEYVIWGGSSKGVTFSFFCTERYGIAPPLGIIDSDQNRQGKFIHTSGVKIFSPKEGLSLLTKNDVLVISNPVYKDEILDQIQENTENKMKLMILT